MNPPCLLRSAKFREFLIEVAKELPWLEPQQNRGGGSRGGGGGYSDGELIPLRIVYHSTKSKHSIIHIINF